MIIRFLPIALATVLPAIAQDAPGTATPAKPVEGHGHATGAAPASGLKKELIEGLTEKDFIKLGDKEKTVKILLVATWSDENYGMNFNGFAKGGVVYTIPKDWTVEVTFINPGPVPHSLLVIEKENTKKIQMAEPYFEGAAVPKHLQGISYGKASFSFSANEAGEYAFACGFPAHSINGHWIGLDVSAEAKVPRLKVGDKAAVEVAK